jgi:hypothetical protein
MKRIFLLVLTILFYSCGTSSGTAETQYEPTSQEDFRNSPLDTNGGFRNTSSFRNDSERYNRPEYWNSQIPRKYDYWNFKKIDTIGKTKKKKKDRQ